MIKQISQNGRFGFCRSHILCWRRLKSIWELAVCFAVLICAAAISYKVNNDRNLEKWRKSPSSHSGSVQIQDVRMNVTYHLNSLQVMYILKTTKPTKLRVIGANGLKNLSQLNQTMIRRTLHYWQDYSMLQENYPKTG